MSTKRRQKQLAAINARRAKKNSPAGSVKRLSDDPSNRLDEQRRRLDELVQKLEQASRLDEPADRSNRRRLAWLQFGF